MDSKLLRDKVIILYILDYYGRELSNSDLSELILEMDDMDYFRLQEGLHDLASSGLIHQRSAPGTTWYRITPEGKAILDEMKDEIHPERLAKLRGLLGEHPEDDPERLVPEADYYRTAEGMYYVRCRIIKAGHSQMECTLCVPSESAAEMICLNWPQKSQDVYEKMMEELL